MKKQRIVLALSLAGIFSLSGSIFAAAIQGQAQNPDLSKIASGDGWKVVNRGMTAVEDGGRKVARLDERPGSGLAWREGSIFSTGTIEFDVRGRDAAQRSFVGVVFNGLDDETWDAVYFRPFNFKSPNPDNAAHSVQYVSHPEFTWQKLRAERAGQFEKTVQPLPDPNGWFHVRIVVTADKVSVYVDGAKTACLEVEKLGNKREGRVGLFVGNNSGGDFANLTIVPAGAAK
jgi:hypothetical protein